VPNLDPSMDDSWAYFNMVLGWLIRKDFQPTSPKGVHTWLAIRLWAVVLIDFLRTVNLQ